MNIGQNFPRSETGTNPLRMSAFEDLLKRTLSSVAGLWGRIFYLASLRDEKGGYEHWGFTRAHGESAAQAAFSQAHSSAFSQALRTPLPELLEDMELAAGRMEISTAELIARLREQTEQSVPRNLAGGTVRHFNSVLDALFLVHSARQNSIHRAA